MILPDEIGASSRDMLDRLARYRPTSEVIPKGPGARQATTEVQHKPPPAEFPGYRVIHEVGRGGMGTVYRAEQIELKRPVALKILTEGRMAGPGERERFRREVRALARLRHANVVRIYEVGEHEGIPFLVMEWIEGGDLANHLRNGPLPMRQASEIALSLAQAVQAAHDRGIIHRDLKPGNVLLSTEGEDRDADASSPTPKVSDFGLAKLAEDDNGSLTLSGVLIGTPGYMAPEQTGLLSCPTQGPATDIYGLGAILYEMLVGRPPFGGGSRAETIHQVVSGDIVPPRRLRPAIPRDLETICMKCLEREPSRRYISAGTVADELGRFLEGRPVQARRTPPWERAVRWGHRRPAEAALLLALLTAVVLGFASVTWLWRVADAEARRAVQAAEAESSLRAEAQAEVAVRDLERGLGLARSGDIGQGLLWMAEAIRETPAGRTEFLRMARANMAAWDESTISMRAMIEHDGTISQALYRDDGGAILTGSYDGTARLWDAAAGRPIAPPIHHGDRIQCVALSRDGRFAATGGFDRKARIWEVGTGRPVGSPLVHGQFVTSVALAPDGRTLATRDAEAIARLWDVASGRPIGKPIAHVSTLEVRFTPDGRSLVTGGEDGAIRFWQSRDGRLEKLALQSGSPVAGLAFGPDPRRLASWHADGIARVWNLDTGRPTGPPLPAEGPQVFPAHRRALVFSPDGRALLVLGTGGMAYSCDPVTGRAAGPALHHPPVIQRAAFSPDGRLVLTGIGSSARLWDVATGRPIGPLMRHRLLVSNIAFAPDGRSFMTAGDDGTARIWGLDDFVPMPTGTGTEAPETGPRASASGRAAGIRFEQAVVSPDRGRILLRGENSGLVRLVDPTTGEPIGFPLCHTWSRVGAAAFSPIGDRFATSGMDHSRAAKGSRASTCQIFDAATVRPATPMLPHIDWPARLTFRGDGRVLATGDFSGSIHLWDVVTGRSHGPPLDAGSIVLSLAFSHDGHLLAAGTAEPAYQVVLWDMKTRQPRGEPVRFKDWALDLAFSPDGSRLAAASADGTARLIDTASGRPIGEPLGHAGRVGHVVFGHDGRTLLTATRGMTEGDAIRSWNSDDGRPLGGSILLPGTLTASPDIAPDGSLLATGCSDGSIALWDLATTRPVGPARFLRGAAVAVSIDPGGSRVRAVDEHGNVSTWPIPPPSPGPADRLADRIRQHTGVELDSARQVAVLDGESWRRLRGGDKAGPSTDPFGAIKWHEACARDSEAIGNGFASRWHLDRLIALLPGDGLLHARRAVARLREQSDSPAVGSDLERALTLGPLDRVVDWLTHRAEDLRASGDAAGALFLLNRAVAARPQDWRLHDRLAEALGELGQPADSEAALARAVELGADIPTLMRIGEGWARTGRYREAALLFDRAIERGDVPYEVWEWAALSHLAADDEDGYRRTCTSLRARYAALQPQVARALAHVCILAPGGLGEDGKATAWATGSVRHMGSIDYRAGRYAEAVSAFRRQIAETSGPINAEDAAFLAMALHRSGEQAAAAAMLARCPRPRDPGAGILHRQQQSADQLYREAERLIFGEPLPEDVFVP